MTDKLKKKIRTIPHWPIKGVMFRDVTTLLLDGESFRESVDVFYNRYKDMKIDKIVGIESRGFIFGAALAYLLKIGFVPIRKPGKLPSDTIKAEYEKEYGKDTVEIHSDAIKKGERVIIIDDLIATGGTVSAACQLVEKLGGKIVECAFVIDLPDLGGKEKIKDYNIYSMMEFEGE